ncbi:MAG: hypothetical protein V5A55_11515 [Halovenus sp.]
MSKAEPPTDANTPLEDVRDVFDEVRGPVVLSADVADALGCTRVRLGSHTGSL